MPTSFTTQRSILRNLVVGGKIQAALAAVMADADLTYRMRPETSGFMNTKDEMESDYQYAGKGSSFATESRLIARHAEGSFSSRVDDYLAGWMLAMVMGKDTFTAGVDPAPNTHVFTWKDTGDPAELTNIYADDAPGVRRKWQDVSLTKLVLSGADKGSLMAQASMIATGRYVDGAMVALPALPAAQYLYGSDTIVQMGASGAPASMAPRVLSWEATFDHQNDLFRSCGGGVYPVFPRYGNPVCGLKLVIAIDTTADIRNWARDHTELEIKLVTTSGATVLTLDYPRVVLPNADLGETDKYVTYTLDLNQENILKPDGGEVCTATLVNTADEYLQAAA